MTSILKITDGTTTIDLLNSNTSLHLVNWQPAIAQLKDNGVYQDSSIAPGSQLVYGQFANANEVFNFHINNQSQDALIRDIQDLLRLLQKARNYWLTQWQDTSVYLIAQSSCETNIRYAIVKNYTFQSLTNPYAQPFFNATDIAAMNDLTLGIERGDWLANIPGLSDCVEVSAEQLDWAYNAIVTTVDSTPLRVYQFIQADVSGDIFSACRNSANTAIEFRTSTDDGVTWASNYTGVNSDQIYGSYKDSNGNLYFFGNGGIWRTPDEGTNWTRVYSAAAVFTEMIEADNGYLYTGSSGNILQSTDNGVTWASVYAVSNYVFYAFNKLPNGTLIATAFTSATAKTNIYRSTDNGANWTFIQQYNNNSTQGLFNSIVAGTTIYLFGQTNASASGVLVILKSTDNGQLFTVHTVSDTIRFALASGDIVQSQFDDNVWYLYGYNDPAGSAAVFRSIDTGYTWQKLYDTNVAVGAGVTVYGNFETSTGNLLNGGTDTQRFVLADTIDLGRDTTCDNEVYIINKQNIANLTDIKISDGGVFSDIFPASLPQTLLPAVPATNDALYFGINTSVLDSGPFSGLVFDLSTGAISTTSYTITWEYWNGATWGTLTTQDNTSQLSVLGVNSVHWEIPSDWATTVVDSVTGYWVRARVSALTGTLTPPVQANRDIYSLNMPYINIASTQVLGDIPALLQVNAINQSDKDGPGGSAPNLYANRIIAGLRSYDRGTAFQAYLNLSDEQNPAGVTVTVGTNTTFATDVQTATGRRMTYNPTAAPESMATRASITLSTSIARDFYGTFHAFLRAKRSAGSASDFDIQLQIVSGSGGVSFTTDSKQLQTTTAYELLDFGQIKLPVAGNLGLSELGDTTTINIQANNATDTVDLYLYDLILIPTDEWSIDAVDKANESDSEIGRSNSIQKYLDIDSVTKPKYPQRTIVKQTGTGFVTSIYDAITPQEAILQANAQQRLWFLAAKTSATGTSYYWLSPVEISHTIQIYKNERYLALRGDR